MNDSGSGVSMNQHENEANDEDNHYNSHDSTSIDNNSNFNLMDTVDKKEIEMEIEIEQIVKNTEIKQKISPFSDSTSTASTTVTALGSLSSSADAAIMAGRNAVRGLRNGKKGYALSQSNKVRKACLRIPLIFSYRTQRLPSGSTNIARTAVIVNDDMIREDVNPDISCIESDIVKEECGHREKHFTSYYFPAEDCKEWLCVYRK